MYIPQEYYYSEKHIDGEYISIFEKSWLFIGLTTELVNNNDFITADIAGRSIVVQNFRGNLHAFQNVCAHRFNRIQTENKGNRPFMCQYHGWAYNQEGKPIGIPQKNTFNPEDINCVKLKKYQLEVCGKFVFVKIDTDDSVDLKEFLGTFYPELEEISNHIGDQLGFEEIHHSTNWKLLIENVLEGYHCPLLHPGTLVRDGFCTKMADDIVFEEKHSKWHSSKTENEFSLKKSNKLKFLEERTYHHDSFYHIHVYPTFVFSSTEGYLFYIGNLIPIDANNTILRVRFYGPVLPEEEGKTKYIKKAFFDAAVETGLKVIEEDRSVIQYCQKGIKENTNSKGILSNVEEVRLKKFHEIYLKDMNNGK